MGRPVRVAIAQFESIIGDVEQNIIKAESFIVDASNQAADIICFPELFATGYNLAILKDSIISLSRDYKVSIDSFFSQSAKKHNINIIAPIAYTDNDGKLFNSALLYDRSGKNIGKYNKIHAFNLEKKYFTAGNELPVFKTDFGMVGVIICYDVCFPETARSLTLKGSEIIFVPSAWRIQDENAWNLNIPSRALENQLFTVGVNRCGVEGELVLMGNSMICNPIGEVIARMDYKTSGVLVYQIDLDDVTKWRDQWSYLKDRKPEVY